MTSTVVLDASALLALLQREPGQEVVAQALGSGGASISAVNLSEVVAKLRESGAPEQTVTRALNALAARGLEVVDFDEALAFAAGFLRPATRVAGLSLGDRACLALGQVRKQPVLTADRTWAHLDVSLGTRVTFIHP